MKRNEAVEEIAKEIGLLIDLEGDLGLILDTQIQDVFNALVNERLALRKVEEERDGLKKEVATERAISESARGLLDEHVQYGKKMREKAASEYRRGVEEGAGLAEAIYENPEVDGLAKTVISRLLPTPQHESREEKK